MMKTSCRKWGRRCAWVRGAITPVEWVPEHPVGLVFVINAHYE